jgi:hypothetical protein
VNTFFPSILNVEKVHFILEKVKNLIKLPAYFLFHKEEIGLKQLFIIFAPLWLRSSIE